MCRSAGLGHVVSSCDQTWTGGWVRSAHSVTVAAATGCLNNQCGCTYNYVDSLSLSCGVPIGYFVRLVGKWLAIYAVHDSL